uniref:Ribosomal protein S3 n=1 Tax=Montagnia macrospora TaxID=2662032 RepID=A0A343UXS4_9FLOR|nr:ribosomal protein S3 [Montagnia macrospora]AVK39481.1 ribosomal protein S3 [Montagnia macrospora]
MAQKINPTSTRLGKQVFWKSIFQTYGKTLNNFSFFHFFILYITSLSTSLQEKNIFLITNFIFLPSSSLVIFTVPLPNLTEKIHFQSLLNTLRSYKYWWSLKSTLLTYFSLNSTKSAQFITSYFKFLIIENFLFRKALSVIIFSLKQQIGHTKVVVSKLGFKKITLKGFKIVLVGRFENSKTQMSRKLDYRFGSLALLSLNSFVEFSGISVNSPLGVYNLKVWLFYR